MQTGSDGQSRRSHVDRRINETEAAVVRRIFELCANGTGKVRIAKQLNAAGAPAPRSQQGRPRAWASSSVHEILYRPLYRGEIVWNQTRKHDPWGQQRQSKQPESEWIRRPAPALRVVPEDLWAAAHARLAHNRRLYLRGTGGRLWGRPAGSDSKYLLPGFGRCSCCNGVMHVRTHAHGSKRVGFYACTSCHKRGSSVCGNHLEVPMRQTDALALGAIADQVLISADVLEEIIARTLAAAANTDPAEHLEQLQRFFRVMRR
jgi:hypothetical protein